jgi:hypothetical protein
MMKQMCAVALAVGVCAPEAASQTLFQRSDWQERKLESYLPRVNVTVPWLEINPKTKLPKSDLPLGRNVASVGPFVLPPVGAGIQASTNLNSPFWRM